MSPSTESSNSEHTESSESSVESDCNSTSSSASDSTENDSTSSESSSDDSSEEEIDEDFDITNVEIAKVASAETAQASDISSADVAANVSKSTIDASDLDLSNDLKESKFIDHTSDRASEPKYALSTSSGEPSHISQTTLSNKSDSQDLPDPFTIRHEFPKSPGPEKRSPVNVSCSSPKSEGWGDEPGPASWDWKEMPFDYMGILEEQRRTVFYEYREQDGKGEWNVPQYDGAPTVLNTDDRAPGLQSEVRGKS